MHQGSIGISGKKILFLHTIGQSEEQGKYIKT